jgi:hypothetical protein
VNGPIWLTDLLVALLLAIMGFFGWRILAARGWQRSADYPRDAFYALAALAVAGTQAKWIGILRRPVWAVGFLCAALFFGVVAVRAYPGGDGAAGSSWRRPMVDAGVALVLVYMFAAGVAPSNLSGSSAGMVVMAGMPGMIITHPVRYPTLGLLLAVYLLWYAVVGLDRLSVRRATPAGDRVDPMDRPGPLPMLAPRVAQSCELVLAVVMAYAIIAHLV